MSDWGEQFPFWSESVIRRTINNLAADGLLLQRTDLNAYQWDKTTWFAIDYDRLERVETAAAPVLASPPSWANAPRPSPIGGPPRKSGFQKAKRKRPLPLMSWKTRPRPLTKCNPLQNVTPYKM